MKATKNTSKLYLKEVKQLKKALIILLALGMLFAMGSIAFAVQDADGDGTPETGGPKGDIVANRFDPMVADDDIVDSLSNGQEKDWEETVQGNVLYTVTGNDETVHPYGTWNSPYTYGIDGYNYNDSQDYDTMADDGHMEGDGEAVTYVNGFSLMGQMMGMSVPTVYTTANLKAKYASGPHGGYLTSTHKCRECHAVHRAAGKFKLTRSDTRFEACDWCHGTGAGSGFNIQMDNDDDYTTEYNVGHTMGYGIESNKWKAPDDTYPAFTPNYYLGGFSCFDCHSPHANPSRLMGFDEDGVPIPSIVNTATGDVFNIGNPGHDMSAAADKINFAGDPAQLAAGNYFVPALNIPLPKAKPYYKAGSWLLIENPDREIATATHNNVGGDIAKYVPNSYKMGMTGVMMLANGWHLEQDDQTLDIAIGEEIPDSESGTLSEFNGDADGSDTAFPVNKMAINWDDPVGSASMWTEDFDVTAYMDYWNAINSDYGQDGTPDPFAMDFPPSVTDGSYGDDIRNPFCRSLILDEFCADCHDGNAGLSTVQAPLFSEDRALRGQTTTSTNGGSVINGDEVENFKGYYDLAYGHDSQIRH